MTTNGLLEFVTVPWSNYNKSDINNYDNLTINLALWFVHVLAGNNHKVDWGYPGLREESPKAKIPARNSSPLPVEENAACDSEPPESEALSSPNISFSARKRKWISEAADPIQLSFSYDPQFSREV